MTGAENRKIHEAKTIAICYGGLAGLGAEIKGFEFSPDGDYVLFVWIADQTRTAHKRRIYYGRRDYFISPFDRRRVFLDECIRC